MFDVTQSADGRLTLRGEGELDVATAVELRRLFADAATSGASEVVVDLTDVTFLDSSGIGVLVEGHRGLEAVGASLVVRVATPATMRVLEVSGMDRYLTLERAVA